jgi:hypothetical protein
MLEDAKKNQIRYGSVRYCLAYGTGGTDPASDSIITARYPNTIMLIDAKETK